MRSPSANFKLPHTRQYAFLIMALSRTEILTFLDGLSYAEKCALETVDTSQRDVVVLLPGVLELLVAQHL